MAGESLKDYYHSFNGTYFRSRLPRDARVMFSSKLPEYRLGEYQPGFEIQARRMRGPEKGSYRTFYRKRHTILINKNLGKPGYKTTLLTLLHEMVHLKLELQYGYGGHGPMFQREMKKLAARGALNQLW